jgi:hypothetical protein
VSASFTLTSINSYAGKINVTCDATALRGAICSLSPANPIAVVSGGSATLNASISVTQDANAGAYDIDFNAQDATGAPSHSAKMTLTVAADFRVISSTASQTVKAGQTSGAYNLRVQPVGQTFNAPVTLGCSAGLPAGAQCIFSPSTPVTPGNTAVDVVMSISTQAHNAVVARSGRDPILLATWIIMPVLALSFCNGKKRRYTGAMIVLLLLLWGMSCGVSSGGGGGGSTPPGNPVTYHVTVTGTSPGTPPNGGQSTVVVLVVD